MANSGFGDDGTIDDLPWASVFDPAANARALSAIQAEGFRAASRIVDRFVRAVESQDTAGSPAVPAGTDVPDSRVPVNRNGAGGDAGPARIQDLERLTRAWWSMVGQFLLRSTPAASREAGVVSLDVNEPSTGALTLAAAVGGSAGTEVWLHNRGPDDRPDVRLQCSDLLSHDGDVIGADAVQMDTDVVPMPRRSSRGVGITLTVAPDVRPGVYRGTLLASGHPELWLPVVLTVRLPGS